MRKDKEKLFIIHLQKLQAVRWWEYLLDDITEYHKMEFKILA